MGSGSGQRGFWILPRMLDTLSFSQEATIQILSSEDLRSIPLTCMEI